MSDTLTNALRDSAHSGSVLAGIANPAQLNPLAGMGTAMDMVGKMQGLDKSQAEQRAGIALQGAINAQGEFDPNAARANLKNDPSAAYAVGSTLSNVQNISSNQLEQARAKVAWTNNAAGSLTRLGPAITPQDALGVLRQGLTSGMLTQAEYERQAAEVAGLGNDPAKLNAWANQHQFGAMSAGQQLEQTFGAPFKQTGPGGVTIGGTQNQRTGAVSGPAGQQGLPQGPSAETTWGLVETSIPLRADGTRIPIGPDGRPTETPIRWERGTVPRGSLPGPTAPGASGAAAPGATSPTFGDGRGNFQPPQAGSPLLNTRRPQQTTQTTAPAQPTLATTGPTQDQPTTLQANVDAYNKDQAAHPALRTRLENMGHAYDALQQMQVATGQGAAGINRLRSGLQTLGLLPKGAVDDQAVVDEWNKYTTRLMTDAAGGNATDLGRHISEQSNPGSALSPQANFHILRNDMGKAVQQMAIYQAHDANTGGAGYLKHRADMVGKTDPRGFVWDMYSPQEQAAINAEVARDKTGVAREKLLRARGMTDVLQLHAPITGGQ